MITRFARAARAAAAAIALAAATAPLTSPAAEARSAREIDAGVDTSLIELFRLQPQMRSLYENSYGALVLPDIVKGGFIVGGAYGEGGLVRGGVIDSYWTFYSASVGFQAGAQRTRRVLFFMTPQALTNFLISDGASVGADAELTVVDAGGEVTVDTRTGTQEIIVVTFSHQGLLGGASVQGGRYQRFTPD